MNTAHTLGNLTAGLAGKMITFEGIEGVGKTTAVAFAASLLQKYHLPFVMTREPGGTVIAESIRQVLLEKQVEKMQDLTELLLMFAGRAQHWSQVIQPALAAGKWVLCDRFTDASYAYQGGGRGIAEEKIQALETLILGHFQPVMTVLLDAPVALSLERAKQRQAFDRIEEEQLDFFERVRQTYLDRAQRFGMRYRTLDATQPLINIQQQLTDLLYACIGIAP